MEYIGIEIYAYIDAFSRKLLWIYFGYSAKTQVSVVLQYLDYIQTAGCVPDILRIDIRNETFILADAHYFLRRANDGRRNR